MRPPSGENATEQTQCEWPFNGPHTTFPLSTSQTRIVVSSDAEAMRVLSEETAIAKTMALCPSTGLESALPASHARHVEDAMRLPLGDKATNRDIFAA